MRPKCHTETEENIFNCKAHRKRSDHFHCNFLKAADAMTSLGVIATRTFSYYRPISRLINQKTIATNYIGNLGNKLFLCDRSK